jgi:hypothetical protein
MTQEKALFLQDLQDLFQKAVQADQLALAVKIKELMGKAQGFFTLPASRAHPKPLTHWSQEELTALLDHLDTLDPQDQSPHELHPY